MAKYRFRPVVVDHRQGTIVPYGQVSNLSATELSAAKAELDRMQVRSGVNCLQTLDEDGAVVTHKMLPPERPAELGLKCLRRAAPLPRASAPCMMEPAEGGSHVWASRSWHVGCAHLGNRGRSVHWPCAVRWEPKVRTRRHETPFVLDRNLSAQRQTEGAACVWHWHRSHLAGISGAHSGAGLQMGETLQDSCAMQLPVE